MRLPMQRWLRLRTQLRFDLAFMRTIFLFLLMANLVALAWTLGYFGEAQSGREPQRISAQLHPETIQLLREPPTPAVSVTCQRLSGFASPLAAEALKIELDAALGGKGDWVVSLTNIAAATEFWVGIPALATTALAEKKKAELIAAKFTDLKLIEDASSGLTGGPFVILIAKFADEAAAKKYLAAQSKTLRTARVLPREREAKSLLEISGPAKDFESRTKDLLAPHALTAAACEAGDRTAVSTP